jgi:predicted ATP-dependent protease
MAQLRPTSPSRDHADQDTRRPFTEAELTPDEVAFSISAEEIRAFDDGREQFDIIGQPRALRALKLAIDIDGKGYNVFATGLAGTGKRTAIMRELKNFRPRKSRLKDIAFVHNFRQPDRPRVLYFTPGTAAGFRKEMAELVENLQGTVTALTLDKDYKEERDALVLEAEGRETQAVAEFEQKLKSEGFEIVQVSDEDERHADIAPIYQGESSSFDELQRRLSAGELEEDVWNEIREKYYRFTDEMKQIFQDLRSDRLTVEDRLRQLQVELIRPELEEHLARMRIDYPDARVHHYLDELAEYVLNNLHIFRSDEERSDECDPAALWQFGVNIVVDHSETKGVPVIYESHPDYHKLFGSQESTGDPVGERQTTFMQLRAGSLLQASGGFLILRAEDILSEDDSWNGLKRALQDGTTEIRGAATPFAPGPSLKPEPIEVAIKAIVMGNEHIYDYLYSADEEFQKLFKVPAEFDSVMVRDQQATREYIGFIRMICRDEGLRSIDLDGIAAIIEYGVRLSEFRDRLSTQFSKIADLIREGDYWAAAQHHRKIGREDIARALSERKFLYDLPESKIDEQILSGELLISVGEERAVGRINGLAVLDRGYYSFARPILITARVAPGSNGIINIERESGLSGEIHDKGVYILEGFLQSTYAREFPLSVNASVAFEQSYVEVDGDSASSAEVYAILSAIADVPLRQEIAVTGSVSQLGQIQPVGGISDKVEGFYEVCRKIGITGRQGVIIPRQNVLNLILNKEIQAAVTEGSFHIYTAETIDEGIAILTGMETGVRLDGGSYPDGSLNAKVEARLRDMANQVKDFGSN